MLSLLYFDVSVEVVVVEVEVVVLAVVVEVVIELISFDTMNVARFGSNVFLSSRI